MTQTFVSPAQYDFLFGLIFRSCLLATFIAGLGVCIFVGMVKFFWDDYMKGRKK